ncbi:hypothetical protein [Aeromonas hydrophila]
MTKQINNDTVLHIQCDKGHNFNITYGELMGDHDGCPYCVSAAVDIMDLLRIATDELGQQHRRIRETVELESINHLIEMQYGTVKHQGPTFEVSASKYINLSISNDNVLIYSTFQSDDSICEHENRICFCGTWEVSNIGLMNNTYPELMKLIKQ